MESQETETIHGHTTAYRSPDGTTTMREWEHEHDHGEKPHTHELDEQTIIREWADVPNATQKTTENPQPGTGKAPEEAGEYTRRVWYGED